MSIVILGILTKTTLILLGLTGLLLAITRRMAERRQVLPVSFELSSQFSSPARLNTRWLISSPSRAPPGVTLFGLRATRDSERF